PGQGEIFRFRADKRTRCGAVQSFANLTRLTDCRPIASLDPLVGAGLLGGILTTVDVRDAVLAHPVFGPNRGQRAEARGPGQLALVTELLYRAYRLRVVQTANRHADAAALHAVIRQWGAAGTAKVPHCDVRAHEGRR